MAFHSRRQFAQLLPILSLAFLAACGPEGVDSAGARSVVSDSAGIEIHTFDLTSLPELQVAPSPTWSIGEQGSGVDLHGVRDARPLSDSLVAIINGGTEEVVLALPPDSTWRIGGAGDGPAEFDRITQVLPEGPQVGIYDGSRNRYVVMDRDGTLLSATRTVEGSSPASTGHFLPLDEDAYMLAEVVGAFTANEPGVHRTPGPIMRVTPESVDTLTMIPGWMFFVSSTGTGAVPYGHGTEMVAGDGAFWIGDQAKQEVVLWPQGPQPERIVRWTGAPDRALTDATVQDFIDSTIQRAGEMPPAAEEQFRQTMTSIEYPSEVPAFGRLAPDGEGGVWVGMFTGAAVVQFRDPVPPTPWIHIRASGEPGAKAVMPEGFDPTYFGGEDFVIGIFTNDLDVQSVRRYDLGVGEP